MIHLKKLSIIHKFVRNHFIFPHTVQYRAKWASPCTQSCTIYLKIEMRDISYRMSDRNTVTVRTVNFISVPSSTPDNSESLYHCDRTKSIKIDFGHGNSSNLLTMWCSPWFINCEIYSACGSQFMLLKTLQQLFSEEARIFSRLRDKLSHLTSKMDINRDDMKLTIWCSPWLTSGNYFAFGPTVYYWKKKKKKKKNCVCLF